MPGDTASPALIWGRACVTALVALGLAVVAHASAGGAVPPMAVAVLALTLVVAAAAFLRRPATTRRLITLVAGGQTLGHLALTAVAGHGEIHPTPRGGGAATAVVTQPAADSAWSTSATTGLAPGQRTGSLRDLAEVTSPHSPVQVSWTPPHWATHVLDDLSGTNAVMAVCHLLAAVLLGWWLARGEEALWTLLLVTGCEARVAGRRLGTALAARSRASWGVLLGSHHRAPERVAGPRRRNTWDVDDRPSWLLASSTTVSRRGPPHALAPL